MRRSGCVSAQRTTMWRKYACSSAAEAGRCGRSFPAMISIITRSNASLEKNRSAIPSRSRKANRSGFSTAAACPTGGRTIIISSSCPDLRLRTGPRARSCTRSLWTVFTTGIRPTMWRTGNIFISGRPAGKSGTGTRCRLPLISGISMAGTCRV